MEDEFNYDVYEYVIKHSERLTAIAKRTLGENVISSVYVMAETRQWMDEHDYHFHCNYNENMSLLWLRYGGTQTKTPILVEFSSGKRIKIPLYLWDSFKSEGNSCVEIGPLPSFED